MHKTFAFYSGCAGLLVVLSVVLLTIRTESQISDEQITQMIKEGVKHAKRREFKKAEEVSQEGLAQQPENAVAHNELANSYVREGKYASAIREYYTALRYDSTDTSIYRDLRKVYHYQMEITKNEADIGTKKSPAPKQDWKDSSEWAFNQAFTEIVTVPTESQVSDEKITQMIKEGVKHAKREEFKDAEEVFKEVLAQQPDNTVAHNNLANTYVLEGKYASAIREYYTALQYDSADTSIYLNLGTVYYLQMEITKNEADIGNQKSSAPKQDWNDCSKWAFDQAFKNISSVTDACRLLKIPAIEEPRYSWVQRLLSDAAKRTNKLANLNAGGVRHGSQWRIPVYWK